MHRMLSVIFSPPLLTSPKPHSQHHGWARHRQLAASELAAADCAAGSELKSRLPCRRTIILRRRRRLEHAPWSESAEGILPVRRNRISCHSQLSIVMFRSVRPTPDRLLINIDTTNALLYVSHSSRLGYAGDMLKHVQFRGHLTISDDGLARLAQRARAP